MGYRHLLDLFLSVWVIFWHDVRHDFHADVEVDSSMDIRQSCFNVVVLVLLKSDPAGEDLAEERIVFGLVEDFCVAIGCPIISEQEKLCLVWIKIIRCSVSHSKGA